MEAKKGSRREKFEGFEVMEQSLVCSEVQRKHNWWYLKVKKMNDFFFGNGKEQIVKRKWHKCWEQENKEELSVRELCL